MILLLDLEITCILNNCLGKKTNCTVSNTKVIYIVIRVNLLSILERYLNPNRTLYNENDIDLELHVHVVNNMK